MLVHAPISVTFPKPRIVLNTYISFSLFHNMKTWQLQRLDTLTEPHLATLWLPSCGTQGKQDENAPCSSSSSSSSFCPQLTSELLFFFFLLPLQSRSEALVTQLHLQLCTLIMPNVSKGLKAPKVMYNKMKAHYQWKNSIVSVNRDRTVHDKLRTVMIAKIYFKKLN